MKKTMMKFAKTAATTAAGISLVLFGIPFLTIGLTFLARFWAMIVRMAI